jgi:hypothetical protein
MSKFRRNIKRVTDIRRLTGNQFTRLGLILVALSITALVIVHRKPAQAACAALPTTYGSATQTFNIPSNGTYRLWSRIMAPDTTNNSYYVDIDSTNCGIVVGDSAITANTWTWVDYQSGNSTSKIDIPLTAGTHTITMTGREADVEVDRLIFTTDTSCVPTGTGDNCGGTPDTTPPSVSVTAPGAGATVSGSSVTLSANATDAVGVVGVQFKVDGANVGAEDTISAYSISWNSTTTTDGTHLVTAVARDAAGNSTTSSPVSVTVNNSTPGSLTMGYTGLGASDDSGNAGQILGQQASLASSATIQSLAFYVSTAAGQLRLGVYDSTGTGGGPGTKVAEAAEFTPTTGWNTVGTTTHPTLQAGTYWLVYAPSNGGLHFKNDSAGTFRAATFSYGALPTTFPAASNAAGQWSFYANLSTSSGPKPADINTDGSVNITDLSLLLSSYSQTTTNCITNNTYVCDIKNDTPPSTVGHIDIFDLSLLLSGYGS